MPLTTLDRLLWVLCFVGHCGLLTILLCCRRALSFPFFTALIAVNIGKTILLYSTLRWASSEAYFYMYWSLAALDCALQLAVTYELATHVFKPLGGWAPDVRRSFAVLLGLGILIAVGLTWLAAPPTRTLRLAVVIRGDFFSSALISEIFVAMIALSVTFGLPWRTHVARLAQGLGVYSIFGILTDAAHTYFEADWSKDTYATLSRIQITIYLGCILYWTVTLARKEPETLKLPPRLHEELFALQRRAAMMLESLRATGDAS